MRAPNDLLIGLDIGGTALKAVRIRADGSGREHVTATAGRALDRAALLAAIADTVRALARGETIARIGCAVGGLVSADGAMPADATNLPQLAETPLAPLFTEAIGAPCHVLNDAHAAMHGEAWLGAARGLTDVMLLTLGTGIGCGLMLGGQVRDGAHGSAGEIGAWPLSDRRTFEAVASPANVERRTGRRLGDMLIAGDLGADGSVAIDVIGRSLAIAHMLLDLEAIVIGGGIAVIGEPLRVAVESKFNRYCPPAQRHGVSIVMTGLGPYAGAIGAVAPTVLESRA